MVRYKLLKSDKYILPIRAKLAGHAIAINRLLKPIWNQDTFITLSNSTGNHSQTHKMIAKMRLHLDEMEKLANKGAKITNLD